MAGVTPLIGPIAGVVGSGISGFFGIKKGQQELIANALEVVSDVNKSEDARATAIAQVISSEARSESWLTRTWRPLVVLMFTGVLFGYMFGVIHPVNMSPEILKDVMEIVKYSIFGYMPLRTVDKFISSSLASKLLEQILNKGKK